MPRYYSVEQGKNKEQQNGRTERFRLLSSMPSFFRLNLRKTKNNLLGERDDFFGYREHFHGFFRANFVFRVLLKRSLRCTDKLTGYVLQTKVKVLKYEKTMEFNKSLLLIARFIPVRISR